MRITVFLTPSFACQFTELLLENNRRKNTKSPWKVSFCRFCLKTPESICQSGKWCKTYAKFTTGIWLLDNRKFSINNLGQKVCRLFKNSPKVLRKVFLTLGKFPKWTTSCYMAKYIYRLASSPCDFSPLWFLDFQGLKMTENDWKWVNCSHTSGGWSTTDI